MRSENRVAVLRSLSCIILSHVASTGRLLLVLIRCNVTYLYLIVEPRVVIGLFCIQSRRLCHILLRLLLACQMPALLQTGVRIASQSSTIRNIWLLNLKSHVGTGCRMLSGQSIAGQARTCQLQKSSDVSSHDDVSRCQIPGIAMTKLRFLHVPRSPQRQSQQFVMKRISL